MTDPNDLGQQGEAFPEVAQDQQFQPLEAPEVWDDEVKSAFGDLQKLPEGRRYAETWHNHWKNREGAYTRASQEAAQRRREFEEYRTRWDPVSRVLEPHIGTWARQGVNPDQALNQLLSTYQHLQQNPQEGLRELARSMGVDLQQLVQDAPYVDPAVSREIVELRRQQQMFQRYLHMQGQEQVRQQQHQAESAVRSFESTKDEQGRPAFPYIREAWDRMQQLITSGAVPVQGNDFSGALKAAYDQAVWLEPGLRDRMLKDQEKSRAAVREAEAKRAAAASRTVRGTGGRAQVTEGYSNVDDAVLAAAAELGG